MEEEVTVYGADWCHDTTHTREYLEEIDVPYKYVDIEEDATAAEWVRQQNGGKEQKPTVSIGDDVLSVPSDEELDAALEEHGLLRS